MSEWLDKYNPFNSMKALVHVEYWKQIIDKGVIPPPRFVSIDPCGVCNYNCPHCNATEIKNRLPLKMTHDIMLKVIELLKIWKTRSVCIGGGGESLLNPVTYDLIERLDDSGVEVGVVTNGSVILDSKKLLKCKWIGFSMDASTATSYSRMKGVSFNFFYMVLNNIRYLVNRGTEITYKFLVHPINYSEIYDAAKLAKEIGCNIIHVRPGAEPWFNKTAKSWLFDSTMIDSIQQNIEKVQKDLADNNFKVYGITHKFNPDFSVKKSFSKCYACMTTCVINSKGEISLCCDRRGDQSLTLGTIEQADLWGSRRHFDICKSICVGCCPRCTYSHINEIFENVIIKDKMMYDMY